MTSRNVSVVGFVWPARLCCYLLLAVCVGLAGCSGRVPVSGTVVYDDGSPVKEGTVCGELMDEGAYMVQGIIKDGTFSLGTSTAGDGARPGNYKIMIQCRDLGDAERADGKRPAIDGKYGSYETSGLTLEVTSSRKDVKFTVSRPLPPLD